MDVDLQERRFQEIATLPPPDSKLIDDYSRKLSESETLTKTREMDSSEFNGWWFVERELSKNYIAVEKTFFLPNSCPRIAWPDKDKRLVELSFLARVGLVEFGGSPYISFRGVVDDKKIFGNERGKIFRLLLRRNDTTPLVIAEGICMFKATIDNDFHPTEPIRIITNAGVDINTNKCDEIDLPSHTMLTNMLSPSYISAIDGRLTRRHGYAALQSENVALRQRIRDLERIQRNKSSIKDVDLFT